jgi:hypothetical protein
MLEDAEIFETDEALALLSEYAERYGPDERIFYYCFRSLSMMAPCSVFEIRSSEHGFAVTAYGRRALHEIRVSENKDGGCFISTSAQPLDNPFGARERVFEGHAHSPAAWEAVVRSACRVEGATISMNDFAASLRDGWAEYLRVRDDRLGF